MATPSGSPSRSSSGSPQRSSQSSKRSSCRSPACLSPLRLAATRGNLLPSWFLPKAVDIWSPKPRLERRVEDTRTCRSALPGAAQVPSFGAGNLCTLSVCGHSRPGTPTAGARGRGVIFRSNWDAQSRGEQPGTVPDGAACPMVDVRHLVYTASMASKTERLNLRLTSAQDSVLRSAAEARGESASEYVLRHAVDAAEVDLADRRVFVVDDAAWQELQALISATLSLLLPMAQLLANPTVLEEP